MPVHALARRLPAVVALLAFLASAAVAPPAHGAAPRHACRAGEVQVRVTVKRRPVKTRLRCIRPLAGKRGLDSGAAVRRARLTPREVRALLPRRLRARLSGSKLGRADRALDRAAMKMHPRG